MSKIVELEARMLMRDAAFAAVFGYLLGEGAETAIQEILADGDKAVKAIIEARGAE